LVTISRSFLGEHTEIDVGVWRYRSKSGSWLLSTLMEFQVVPYTRYFAYCIYYHYLQANSDTVYRSRLRWMLTSHFQFTSRQWTLTTFCSYSSVINTTYGEKYFYGWTQKTYWKPQPEHTVLTQTQNMELLNRVRYITMDLISSSLEPLSGHNCKESF